MSTTRLSEGVKCLEVAGSGGQGGSWYEWVLWAGERGETGLDQMDQGDPVFELGLASRDRQSGYFGAVVVVGGFADKSGRGPCKNWVRRVLSC